MKPWTDNRVLALARVLGFKVTRKTVVIHVHHDSVLMEKMDWTATPPPTEYTTEEIGVQLLAGMPGIWGLGYGPRTDTLAVRFARTTGPDPCVVQWMNDLGHPIPASWQEGAPA